MSSIIIIPARMGSSRLPGKPLIRLSGLTMIQRCYDIALQVLDPSKIFVATCDVEIVDHVIEFGGNAVLTSATHTRASDRTAEALNKILKNGLECTHVLMMQGDEPAAPVAAIKEICRAMDASTSDYFNVVCPLTDSANKNRVKAVLSKSNKIIYMSREAIPSNWQNAAPTSYMQTGIIGFSIKGLNIFNALDQTDSEIAESVDLNRLLENDMNIQAIVTTVEFSGIDTEEDAKLFETTVGENRKKATALESLKGSVGVIVE